jgi:hypothetical protein
MFQIALMQTMRGITVSLPRYHPPKPHNVEYLAEKPVKHPPVTNKIKFSPRWTQAENVHEGKIIIQTWESRPGKDLEERRNILISEYVEPHETVRGERACAEPVEANHEPCIFAVRPSTGGRANGLLMISNQ